MLSHFYLHITVDEVDCTIKGWRLVEEPTSVTIERILIDGHKHGEEYTNFYLSKYSRIYRELERKLGLPSQSLHYQYFVSN